MSAHSTTSLHAASPLNHLASLWRNLRRSPSGTIGLVIVAAHLLLAVLSPFLVPYDPAAFQTDAIMQSPNATHFFGTDSLGRDVFTRTLLGGRVALVVTLTAIVLALAWGSLLGMLLGFLGGWLDELVMRIVDAFLAIPEILFLLLIASIIGTDSWILILTLGFLYGIEVIRIARSATLSIVSQDYILAAYLRGERRRTIVVHELLPNVLDVLMVEGAMRWSWMLLAFSALSFLGFGVTPPTPDWGLMIAQNRDTMGIAPWATVFPIIAISSLIIGVNLLVGALAKAVGLDRVDGVAV
jgi:peptide/nickel transport system permease protein